MAFTPSRSKHERKVLFKSNKRRCITVNSHLNSNETNNLNAPNSDDVVGNPIRPCINVHTKSSFNALITLQKIFRYRVTYDYSLEIIALQTVKKLLGITPMGLSSPREGYLEIIALQKVKTITRD